MNDLDRELDAALTALRDDGLTESDLASVRAGVRERIQAGHRKRAWTAWLSLAAAAAVGWIAIAIPWTVSTLPLASPGVPQVDSMALVRPSTSPEEARLKPGRSVQAAPLRAASSPPMVLEKVRRGRQVAPPEPAREEQTQFIRIITDDPNVVILWALNSKGETR